MSATYYRDIWAALLKAPPDVEHIRKLSKQIAFSFLDRYLQDCRYETDFIDLLCEMATCSDDPRLIDPAAQALFGIIIERLCDDFDELQTLTYDRTMAQVISFCRKLPDGQAIDSQLNAFGIHTTEDLFKRIHQIRTESKKLADPVAIRKVILLSRVTVGADVAITSVIAQRLSTRLPDAEIVILGGKGLQEIFGGHPKVSLQEISYARRGGLLERLSIWHEVLGLIQNELDQCPLENTILVDPDSRLSQLGILPLIASERYFFLDTRSDFTSGSTMSMTGITNKWLNNMLEEEEFCYPTLWIPALYMSQADRFCRQLREKGTRHIVAVNFGVGGNRHKRIGEDFETGLLLNLLQVPQSVVLLDRGAGDEEYAASEALMQKIKGEGYQLQYAKFDAIDQPEISWGVIGIENTIGQIAALTAYSDEFIGYDSACQHIAAAVETPCLTLFTGSNNMRFIRRWSPQGRKRTRIVHIDSLTNPKSIEIDDVITRIQSERATR